jgi:Glu/Leu/Phe/Val dehydrogenase, dimerisation domain
LPPIPLFTRSTSLSLSLSLSLACVVFFFFLSIFCLSLFVSFFFFVVYVQRGYRNPALVEPALEKGEYTQDHGVFSHSSWVNHDSIHYFRDDVTGLKAIVGIHDTLLGPALGGCRLYNYKNETDALNDVLRLSRGMTFKAACAGLPLGGGCVLLLFFLSLVSFVCVCVWKFFVYVSFCFVWFVFLFMVCLKLSNSHVRCCCALWWYMVSCRSCLFFLTFLVYFLFLCPVLLYLFYF